MDIGELQQTLDSRRALNASMGLACPPSVALVIVRDKPARGDSIRTPFGMARIANQQLKEGKFHIVFYAKWEKIEDCIKRAKLAVDTN